MKFRELREMIKDLLGHRRRDTTTEISPEDINLIESTRWEIPKKTIICFGSLYAFKYLSGYFHFPGLFINPLADTDSVIAKKKIWSRAMANHVIFLGTMSCFLVYWAKFEVTKFYVYLKNENLVHRYMDSLDRRQIAYLKQIDSNKSS